MTLQKAIEAITLKVVEIIQSRHTGKLVVTINFTQGGIGNISASKEERIN